MFEFNGTEFLLSSPKCNMEEWNCARIANMPGHGGFSSKTNKGFQGKKNAKAFFKSQIQLEHSGNLSSISICLIGSCIILR
eukprot:752241-Hanusia_phi.AAC.1